MGKKEKIFFDVDGVLIDGWHAKPELRRPWNATLAEDLGVDAEKFEVLFFGKKDENESLMEACVAGRRDLKEALTPILPKIGYRGTVHEFVDYWFEKDSNFNQDVFDVVMKLAKTGSTELFVVAAQEHRRARFLWEKLEFHKYFAGMFYSAQFGFLKTEKGFFEAVNRGLQITPEERPLFFSDSEEVAGLAASCGWEGVVFNSAEHVVEHPTVVRLLATSAPVRHVS